MEISSSNNSVHRSVTASNNSSDRQSKESEQTAVFERKSRDNAIQQQAVQEKIQQRNEDSQRRLDGRLINFGSEKNQPESRQQEKSSIHRNRVNEAYTSPQRDHYKYEPSDNRAVEAIDIIV